jgi:O-antigen/teichoic acid export membrane protein
LANLCLGIYFNLTFWFKFSGKTYYAILITGLAALFTIVFNILVIPHYSFFGCSVIRLLSYIGMILLAYFLGRKQLEVKYDFRNIFLYFGIALILFGIMYYLRLGNVFVNAIKNTLVLSLFVVFLERREHIISIFLKR